MDIRWKNAKRFSLVLVIVSLVKHSLMNARPTSSKYIFIQ